MKRRRTKYYVLCFRESFTDIVYILVCEKERERSKRMYFLKVILNFIFYIYDFLLCFSANFALYYASKAVVISFFIPFETLKLLNKTEKDNIFCLNS